MNRKKQWGKIAIGLVITMALIFVVVITIQAKADPATRYHLVLPETELNNLDDHTYQWLKLTRRSTMQTVNAGTGAVGAATLAQAAYFATEDDTFKRWGWDFTGLKPGTYLFTVYGSTDQTADSGDTFLKNGVIDWSGSRILGDPRTY